MNPKLICRQSSHLHSGLPSGASAAITIVARGSPSRPLAHQLPGYIPDALARFHVNLR